MTPSDGENVAHAGRGIRLGSWKEIAACLGKAERTVKRWEKERGLPAYRLPGSGNASVYAYAGELDEWLKSRDVPADEPTVEIEAQAAQEEAAVPQLAFPALAPMSIPPAGLLPHSRQRRKWLLAASFLGAAVVLGCAINLQSVRAGTSRIARFLPGSSTQLQGDANPLKSSSVSDSDKQQAHDLYLKGRYEWSQRTPDSLNRALDDFTQAIVHDPGNAAAYVGMADTYDLLREYSTMPEAEAYTRGIAAAKKAVELDDSLSEAHRALAFAEWWGKWDFAAGEKEFRRAIELNPGDPIARNWYANTLAIQGRFAEALEENGKAQELDPSSRSILADKGNLLFYSGQRDQGLQLLKDVERGSPDLGSPHFYLMKSSLEIRDYPSFLAEGRKAAETRNDPILQHTIASAQAGYARDGERGMLNALYASQKQDYLAGKLPGGTLAITCVMMGRDEEGLQLLEQSYDRHDGLLLDSLTNPLLAALREQPRYKALARKIDFQSVTAPQIANPTAGADTLALGTASGPR